MRLLPMGICGNPDVPTSMSQSLPEIRERILQAIANVDESQLRRTWEEFEFCVDVCRVTNGAHIVYIYINVYESPWYFPFTSGLNLEPFRKHTNFLSPKLFIIALHIRNHSQRLLDLYYYKTLDASASTLIHYQTFSGNA
jgi:hypothetical protein